MKRSIWLTGDVHHMSMHGSDQVLNGINKTEVELCEPYLEISNHYGFKPTLFFSGKSIKEEVEKVQELVSKYTFSIGGHTYSTYQPIILSKISRKLFNSPYFLKWFQKNDINKTSDIIENQLDYKIKYWRNHAYQSDVHTNQILSKKGFTRVSNEVDLKVINYKKIYKRLDSYPINTLPDHENLPHSTEHEYQIDPYVWVEKNVEYVKNILNNDGTATLLLHPLCMFLENNFSFMKELLSKIAKYNK